jgi:hypothetical protein
MHHGRSNGGGRFPRPDPVVDPSHRCSHPLKASRALTDGAVANRWRGAATADKCFVARMSRKRWPLFATHNQSPRPARPMAIWLPYALPDRHRAPLPPVLSSRLCDLITTSSAVSALDDSLRPRGKPGPQSPRTRATPGEQHSSAETSPATQVPGQARPEPCCAGTGCISVRFV